MVKAKKPTKSSASVLSSKKHNLYLDVLKGFAILLVVFGHSVQDNMANFDQNIFFRIIYSFHIPLFMFLAGAAAAYSLRPMDWKFIQRKFYMLVIPFIAWGIIDYLTKGAFRNEDFITYAHKIIVSPDYGLWFLWVLFLNFCALVLIKKLTKWFKMYSYLIVWLAIYAIPTGKYGIGLVKWHLPFFLLGYLTFTYREQLAKYRTPVLAFCVISAPILVASWHRLYYPHLLTSLGPRLSAHGIQSITFGDTANIDTYSMLLLFYSYLVPLTMIGFVYWLLQLKPSKHLWRSLGFFGIYTLDIYILVLGSGLVRIGIGSSWVKVISAFVIATTLALLIGIYFLRRIPILSTILLGGRTNPKTLAQAQKNE